MDLLKNTKHLMETEMRVQFFDLLRRPPTKQERESIHELINDRFDYAEMSL